MTGHQEPKKTANALIMPNPVDDHLTFKIDTEELLHGLLRIFHTNGSLVKELNISGNTTRIPAADLMPGIYLLSFSNQHVNIHKRFIKK